MKLAERMSRIGVESAFDVLVRARAREAIAATIRRTRGIMVGPEHVSVVPGGKPIIFFPMLALLEPGDEVIYPDPGFPIYESMIRFLGAKPVPIQLREQRDFRMDVDEITAA